MLQESSRYLYITFSPTTFLGPSAWQTTTKPLRFDLCVASSETLGSLCIPPCVSICLLEVNFPARLQIPWGGAQFSPAPRTESSPCQQCNHICWANEHFRDKNRSVRRKTLLKQRKNSSKGKFSSALTACKCQCRETWTQGFWVMKLINQSNTGVWDDFQSFSPARAAIFLTVYFLVYYPATL